MVIIYDFHWLWVSGEYSLSYCGNTLLCLRNFLLFWILVEIIFNALLTFETVLFFYFKIIIVSIILIVSMLNFPFIPRINPVLILSGFHIIHGGFNLLELYFFFFNQSLKQIWLFSSFLSVSFWYQVSASLFKWVEICSFSLLSGSV